MRTKLGGAVSGGEEIKELPRVNIKKLRKPCPRCGEIIPMKQSSHEKCGWGKEEE